MPFRFSASAKPFGVLLAAAATLSVPLTLACGPVECFRAITCVESCGGRVVQSGCSACPAGSFDDLMCRPDSGPDAPDLRDAPLFTDAPADLDAFSRVDAPSP